MNKWGQRQRVSPPRRADYAGANGYRHFAFWLGGQNYWLLAHRVAYVYFAGAIPRGRRITRDGTLEHRYTPDERRARKREAGRRWRVAHGAGWKRAEHWPFISDATDVGLIARINAAVPTGLPEPFRQEVCQDLAVELLSGARITPALVRRLITAAYRRSPVMAGHQRSLDDLLPNGRFGESRSRYIDVLPAPQSAPASQVSTEA
jgi:hypothetical protein